MHSGFGALFGNGSADLVEIESADASDEIRGPLD
jgi:hypothetical protein